MSPSVSRLINSFAKDHNNKLDTLFTKYLKAKKSYKYYSIISKNLFKKIKAKEQIIFLKTKIKQCFKISFKNINIILNNHQKIVQLVKQHKLFLIERKRLWKRRQFFCKKDEE